MPIARQSEEDRLGPLVKRFGPAATGVVVTRWARRLPGWIGLALLTVGTMVALGALGVLRLYALWVIAFSIAHLLWWGLALVGALLFRPKASVDVHEHGLRYHFGGPRPKDLLWDEVKVRVQFVGYRKATNGAITEQSVVSVLPANGSYQIALDWRFADSDLLRQEILDRTEPFVRDLIAAAIAGGEPFECGAGLKITGDGVSDGARLERWPEIQWVEVREDTVRIEPGFTRRRAAIDHANAVVKAIEEQARAARPQKLKAPYR